MGIDSWDSQRSVSLVNTNEFNEFGFTSLKTFLVEFGGLDWKMWKKAEEISAANLSHVNTFIL